MKRSIKTICLVAVACLLVSANAYSMQTKNPGAKKKKQTKKMNNENLKRIKKNLGDEFSKMSPRPKEKECPKTVQTKRPGQTPKRECPETAKPKIPGQNPIAKKTPKDGRIVKNLEKEEFKKMPPEEKKEKGHSREKSLSDCSFNSTISLGEEYENITDEDFKKAMVDLKKELWPNKKNDDTEKFEILMEETYTNMPIKEEDEQENTQDTANPEETEILMEENWEDPQDEEDGEHNITIDLGVDENQPIEEVIPELKIALQKLNEAERENDNNQ